MNPCDLHLLIRYCKIQVCLRTCSVFKISQILTLFFTTFNLGKKIFPHTNRYIEHRSSKILGANFIYWLRYRTKHVFSRSQPKIFVVLRGTFLEPIFDPTITAHLLTCKWLIERKLDITFTLSDRMQRLSAFDNQLTYAPVSLFQLPTLKKLNLARNNIASLFGELEEGEETYSDTWGCTALKVLTLSFNQLTSLPSGIQGAVGLTKLFLDNNNLRDFLVAWKCPLVR